MPQSPYEFQYRQDDSACRKLRWGLDARNRPSGEVLALLETDSPAADLWEIAGSCYAVDHDAPRPRVGGWRDGKPEWSRNLTVCLPVRWPDFWNEHRHLVEKLLGWMTADEWNFVFHPADWAPDVHQPAIDFWEGPRVTLFSGGLDSTAGLAAELAHRPEIPVRLVTVVTNTRQQGRSKHITDDLVRHFQIDGGILTPTVFHLNMKGSRPREATARSRGFVFLSAAVATAVAYRSSVIRVYENGTGALNLACSRGQVGAQSARPVHPRTLKLMERIAGAVADGPIRIENPYGSSTKAELIAQVPAAYDDLLNRTVSCDTGFSRRAATRHCGVCTSCLLRAQSIVASGKELDLPEPGGGAASKRTHPPAMLWQVNRLRHAFRDGPSWERLVREFPDIVCAPGAFDPGARRELVGLFSRYAREWQSEELSAALEGVVGGGGMGAAG